LAAGSRFERISRNDADFRAPRPGSFSPGTYEHHLETRLGATVRVHTEVDDLMAISTSGKSPIRSNLLILRMLFFDAGVVTVVLQQTTPSPANSFHTLIVRTSVDKSYPTDQTIESRHETTGVRMKTVHIYLFILLVTAVAPACGESTAPEDAVADDRAEEVVSADVPTGEDLAGETVEQGDLTTDAIVEGGFGWPCKGSSDCLTGLCLKTPDGQVCTKHCQEDCPEGFVCATSPALGSQEYVCFPVHVTPCKPCEKDKECFGLKERCVDMGTEGKFCGGPCGEEPFECLEGYTCEEVLLADGTDGEQCVPDSGVCTECPYWAVLTGSSTTCWNANDFGACPGTRACSDKGLGECEGPEPVKEECNGADDDCDGEVDEELLPIACGLGVCEHTVASCVDGLSQQCDPFDGAVDEGCDGLDNDCDGEVDEELGTVSCGTGICLNTVEMCVGGSSQQCEPLDAAVDEECDGLDNDCDGEVDQDFTDTDEDGEADCVDKDDDEDGVGDDVDNCVLTPNPGQEDDDGDGFGDECDEGCWKEELDTWDSDCDDLLGFDDNCPVNYNPQQVDTDSDGMGDACDEDDDNDGKDDKFDNCPLVANPAQEDADKDGIGDACDGDLDGDGVPDGEDNCPNAGNPEQADNDQDSLGDACDDDDDNDGDPDTSDCAPYDETESTLHDELCNGKDDDCDLEVDEPGAVKCLVYYLDVDGDGYGVEEDWKCLCLEEKPYAAKAAGDCEPDVEAVNPGMEEVCNGMDDNCDENVDEGYPDTDQDGKADCLDGDDDADGLVDDNDNCPLVPNENQEDFDQDQMGDECDPDDDNDGFDDEDDCGPFNPDQYPGLVETCDGIDNDCDGKVDQDLGSTSCGLGECWHTVDNCKDGLPQQCYPFEGAVDEKCDLKDNDCDGEADEEIPPVTCGLGECEHTVEACIKGVPQKCNPKAGAKPETCDELDNDCDGEVDDGLGQTTCGIGECYHTIDNCQKGELQECDKMEGATDEVCDGKNNDCDGEIDEDLGQTTCGLGECEHTIDNCVEAVVQVCDPMEGSMPEACDGLDNDCNGEADEGFEDFDLDGVPDCLDDDDDDDKAQDDDDCDDHDPTSYPGANEVCDGADNDCNGHVDEGCPGVVSGTSCADIHDLFPALSSGTYTIDPDGVGGNNPVAVYCDMEADGGGWTRVADVNANKGLCPGEWVYTNIPKVCFRLEGNQGCKSALFNTFGLTYGEVRGYVKAYQFNSMDAFHMYSQFDIDGPYVDGISVTYGTNPRNHIWTYAVGVSQDGNFPDYNCPCAKYAGGGPPAFVGADYYCESGNAGDWENEWYTGDVLFDGKACPDGNSCCKPPDLPWFQKQLPAPQATDVEARLCSDQESTNEDVGVFRMELFVR